MDFSSELPENIFEIRNEKSQMWTEEITLANNNNSSQMENRSTLSEDTIKKAGDLLFEYFNNNEIQLKILEIMCGNCVATKIIIESLKDRVESIISTDIVEYSTRLILENVNFSKANAVEAVEQHGCDTNVLLICSSPPENNYCDLYAIKDYIDQANETKYIIFIGELGMSDGSQGIDKFMKEESSLEEIYKKNFEPYI